MAAMKVFDLRCAQDHRFEGWFGSDDDYASQRERALVECPMCSNKEVERLPSAPRLNLGASQQQLQDVVRPNDAQALWLRALRHIIDHTEDVGERFPDEARRIHYGETEQRGIRGRASREQTEELSEEGIEVMALPIPPALASGPLQ